MTHCPRLLITSGEPAGVGPELCLKLAEQDWPCAFAVLADADQLEQLAAQLLPAPPRILRLASVQALHGRGANRAGELPVIDIACTVRPQSGVLDVRNARMVLQQLQTATDAALAGDIDAIVTAPVHKAVINDAGTEFSGHTEFFAAAAAPVPRTQNPTPVPVLMLLACEGLRVALATTHLPLREVPAALTRARLHSTLHLLITGLQQQFAIARPRIAVLGLNPHAGEGGHMGREEIDLIAPLLQEMAGAAADLVGPLSADTAFTPDKRRQFDAYLAMYHDQGLPVLKTLGFHRSVNITLGLPFIRTSVDHGTALDLAGSGQADPGSLFYALETALHMLASRRS